MTREDATLPAHRKEREISFKPLNRPPSLARFLDLMHVATALLRKARVLLSTENRQRKAAKAEGLDV